MLHPIRLRATQLLRYARPGPIDVTPMQAYLTLQAAATFATLPAGDQRHALAVARQLEVQGAPPNVITAGLLHDIGKAVPGSPVHIADRIAKVVLARVAPGRLHRIAAWDTPRWPLGGLWVLSRHARHGGELVRRWGYPERVAWLVEHHEDRNTGDEQLNLLVAMDDGRPAAALASGAAHD